jgi:hypothetical protein
MLESFEVNGVIRALEWWHTVLSPVILTLVGATVVSVRNSLGYDD